MIIVLPLASLGVRWRNLTYFSNLHSAGVWLFKASQQRIHSRLDAGTVLLGKTLHPLCFCLNIFPLRKHCKLLALDSRQIWHTSWMRRRALFSDTKRVCYPATVGIWCDFEATWVLSYWDNKPEPFFLLLLWSQGYGVPEKGLDNRGQ